MGPLRGAHEIHHAHASLLEAADADLESYLNRAPGVASTPRVAYFSAEFAITECLPIYSGGLGVLAGDHLKAASDLGMPMIGVGLLYRYGYYNRGSTQPATSGRSTTDWKPTRCHFDRSLLL